MSPAMMHRLHVEPRPTAPRGAVMTATCTFDVFCSLDGFGSYGDGDGGDWGGYWGKQGPEFLDRRLAVLSEEQRLVLGATTFRDFLHFLDPASAGSALDPVNTRMKNLPTTVVSTTLEGPLDWPDAIALAAGRTEGPGAMSFGTYNPAQGRTTVGARWVRRDGRRCDRATRRGAPRHAVSA